MGILFFSQSKVNLVDSLTPELLFILPPHATPTSHHDTAQDKSSRAILDEWIF